MSPAAEHETYCASCDVCLCEPCQRHAAAEKAAAAEFDALRLHQRVRLCAQNRCWVDTLYELKVPWRVAVLLTGKWPRVSTLERSFNGRQVSGQDD